MFFEEGFSPVSSLLFSPSSTNSSLAEAESLPLEEGASNSVPLRCKFIKAESASEGALLNAFFENAQAYFLFSLPTFDTHNMAINSSY
ncbi:hypothetical protein FOG18_11905 [Legionella israelensis]|uniref:hypothetical protein n=1 Tax=Legionella israelensis TaxID=454 RepID=UPI001180BDE1|nr:hypothetical protein [Legionella israelensis]QDP73214.1 hypothetical protein FOG18_11905 [Legionella israelensis]